MLFFLFVLNFTFSWFNAWATGKAWTESKHRGGWSRIMAWSGAIMSACGFTWVYLIALAIAGTMIPLGHETTASGIVNQYAVTPEMFQAMLELGYVVVILPILGSGLAMTMNSWAHFYRERSLLNGGVTAWNTFAQISNTYDAVTLLPGFLRDLGGFFGKGSSGNKKDSLAVFVVVLLVCIALGGGILTARVILLASARSHVRNVALDREMASLRSA